VQRRLVHKERNVRARLSKRDWGELARLFKRLREVQGERAAREAYAEIERFLTRKNAAALESFHEAGEELIALHCLNVPATLRVSLLRTNLIENSFRNVRRKLGRVTRSPRGDRPGVALACGRVARSGEGLSTDPGPSRSAAVGRGVAFASQEVAGRVRPTRRGVAKGCP